MPDSDIGLQQRLSRLEMKDSAFFIHYNYKGNGYLGLISMVTDKRKHSIRKEWLPRLYTIKETSVHKVRADNGTRDGLVHTAKFKTQRLEETYR